MPYATPILSARRYIEAMSRRLQFRELQPDFRADCACTTHEVVAHVFVLAFLEPVLAVHLVVLRAGSAEKAGQKWRVVVDRLLHVAAPRLGLAKLRAEIFAELRVKFFL